MVYEVWCPSCKVDLPEVTVPSGQSITSQKCPKCGAALKYESETDRKIQHAIAAKFASHMGWRFKLTPEECPQDAEFAPKGAEKVIAIAEVKDRHNGIRAYPDYTIGRAKIDPLWTEAARRRVRCFLVVRWTDPIIGYWELKAAPEFKVIHQPRPDGRQRDKGIKYVIPFDETFVVIPEKAAIPAPAAVTTAPAEHSDTCAGCYEVAPGVKIHPPKSSQQYELWTDHWHAMGIKIPKKEKAPRLVE